MSDNPFVLMDYDPSVGPPPASHPGVALVSCEPAVVDGGAQILPDQYALQPVLSDDEEEGNSFDVSFNDEIVPHQASQSAASPAVLSTSPSSFSPCPNT